MIEAVTPYEAEDDTNQNGNKKWAQALPEI